MFLPDSNVWISLLLSEHAFHRTAARWFAAVPSRRRVLVCRATQQSVLRLLSTSAVMAPYGIPPLGNKKALAITDSLLADKRIAWAEEPAGLDAIWRTWAATRDASPKLWMDAYLAAFAHAGGHRLVTIDRAFRQFDGLDLELLTG